MKRMNNKVKANFKVELSFYLDSKNLLIIGGNITTGKISKGMKTTILEKELNIDDVTYLDRIPVEQSIIGLVMNLDDKELGNKIVEQLTHGTILQAF